MSRQPLIASLRTLGIAAFAAACLPAAAFQAWSTTGTTGTVDEDSTSAIGLTGSSASVINGASLPRTVTLRYPIQNQWGTEISPTWFGARFTDNGPDAQIVLTLKKLDITAAAAVTLATWDSNAFTASPNTQFQWLHVCPLEALDFTNNTYWIEAQITKLSNAGKVGLSMVRMDNFSPCTVTESAAGIQRLKGQ